MSAYVCKHCGYLADSRFGCNCRPLMIENTECPTCGLLVDLAYHVCNVRMVPA